MVSTFSPNISNEPARGDLISTWNTAMNPNPSPSKSFPARI
jgi:hypothetical protein